MRRAFGPAAIFAASMLAMLALWAVVAWAADDPVTMPTPWQVGNVLAGEAASGTLWGHMWATLVRVFYAFTLAMLAGCVLGLWLGTSPRVNTWADPWVVVALNLPALVVIVLCFIWIGLNEVAAIVAVAFNKTAMVLVIMREGARALDTRVGEMAQVFAMSPAARLRHVVLPQLAPFLAASARNGLAIIWKLVLVVEFLGRPDGVGFQIHFYFQLFDVAHVLAYALSFVALMLVIEYGLVQRIEARANRWKAD